MSTTPTRMDRRREFADRYLKHAVAPTTYLDRPVRLTVHGGRPVVGVAEDARDYDELLRFWRRESDARGARVEVPATIRRCDFVWRDLSRWARS
jgi:hypothetical protein